MTGRWISSGQKTVWTDKFTCCRHGRKRCRAASNQSIQRYTLGQRSGIVTQGRAIGQKIGTGVARIVDSIADMEKIQAGDVLVADMTDPDWEPVMKRASAIVTNRGGRTCHAAIIARELGIPAVVGCGHATRDIKDGQPVTVSCAEGDEGFIYDGMLDFQEQQIELDRLPPIPVKLMMNVGNPDRAFSFAGIPNHGVGLARLEFIINRMIGIHPRALLEFDSLPQDQKDIIRQHIGNQVGPGRVLRRQTERRHCKHSGSIRTRTRHRALV